MGLLSDLLEWVPSILLEAEGGVVARMARIRLGKRLQPWHGVADPEI